MIQTAPNEPDDCSDFARLLAWQERQWGSVGAAGVHFSNFGRPRRRTLIVDELVQCAMRAQLSARLPLYGGAARRWGCPLRNPSVASSWPAASRTTPASTLDLTS